MFDDIGARDPRHNEDYVHFTNYAYQVVSCYKYYGVFFVWLWAPSIPVYAYGVSSRQWDLQEHCYSIKVLNNVRILIINNSDTPLYGTNAEYIKRLHCIVRNIITRHTQQLQLSLPEVLPC